MDIPDETPEVRQCVKIERGQRLTIERADLAGWIVTLDAGPQCCGQRAAFSESAAMLEWLKQSFEMSRAAS